MKPEQARAIAVRAAREAGAIQQGALASARKARNKGPIDLVTEVDLASERRILEILAQECPGIPVLAEEGGGASTATTRWIVDPLDGTTNFVHGLPHFAVSIALQWEGQLWAGCVLDSSRGEEWSAARGCGATLNGQRIQVSPTPVLDSALLATGFPYDRRTRAAYYLRLVAAVLERSQGIRRAGAAALDLAWVAGGRLDGFFELGLAPWDVAAGTLLVQEAGGRVEEIAGGPLRLDTPSLLASNGHIQEELRQILAPLLSSTLHEESGP